MRLAPLLWLAFAALVVTSAVLLLRACALVMPGGTGWSFCPAVIGSDLRRDEERSSALQAEIHRLRLELAAREAQCYADLRPPPPAPPPPQPAPPPQREAARPPEPPPPPRPEPPACKPGAQPRVFVIMDTSNSMNLPAELTPQLAALEEGMMRGDPNAMARATALMRQPGTKRLDIAKLAAEKLVGALSTRYEAGLITFNGCQAQTTLLPTADRAALRRALAGIEARASTPIAASIERLQSMLKGPPAVEAAVLITDGQESCRGDPCAAAQRLHAAKPGVPVHVIDVTGSSGLQCIAQKTGGTITVARDPGQLYRAIAQAHGSIDPDCQPAGR